MDSGFARPRVVVSRCLGLEPCRYNGESASGVVRRLLDPHVDWVDVCPEVQIGLGVPRAPVRLVASPSGPRLVQPSSGRDLTDAMTVFSDAFLAALPPVDGFLLKAASPSCGLKAVKVYYASGHVSGERTAGLFGEAVVERFPGVAVEDEARLNNVHLRHHFFTRIFAAARLRAVAVEATAGALVEFHTRYKLVLMVQGPALLRGLGQIVAGAGATAPREAIARYAAGFGAALQQPARPARMVNALQHAFGYVSGDLSSAERSHFLQLLQRYREARLPLEVLLELLASWIERFDQPYLRGQALFNPYPSDLLQASASRVPSHIGAAGVS